MLLQITTAEGCKHEALVVWHYKCSEAVSNICILGIRAEGRGGLVEINLFQHVVMVLVVFYFILMHLIA